MTILPLLNPTPDTPLFNQLLDERDPKLGPLFDVWNPDWVPVITVPPHQLTELAAAVRAFENASIDTSEGFQGWTSDVEAFHYRACEELKLPLPSSPDEPAPTDYSEALNAILGGQARTDEETLQILMRVHARLQQLGEQPPSDEPSPTDVRVEGDTIEARYETADGGLMIEHDTSEGHGLMLPSRTAMQNSCATCFPNSCDLERPRSMCRRSAPATGRTSGQAMQSFLEQVRALSPETLTGIHPVDVNAEITITSVPAEVVKAASTVDVTKVCPMDGAALSSTQTREGQPTVYRHADGVTHFDRVEGTSARITEMPKCTGMADCPATMHVQNCFAEILDVSRSVERALIDEITAPLEMWFCPNDEHRDVDWDESGVAYCMEVGCDNNSETHPRRK